MCSSAGTRATMSQLQDLSFEDIDAELASLEAEVRPCPGVPFVKFATNRSNIHDAVVPSERFARFLHASAWCTMPHHELAVHAHENICPVTQFFTSDFNGDLSVPAGYRSARGRDRGGQHRHPVEGRLLCQNRTRQSRFWCLLVNRLLGRKSSGERWPGGTAMRPSKEEASSST